MSSEWVQLTIGDLIKSSEAIIQTGPFGSQLHKHDYVDSGVPVIPTEAIGRGQILGIEVPQVGPSKAKELERHRLEVGDILFARRGAQATGLSAIIDQRYVGAICGTGALLLRTDSKRVLPHFLALYLSSEFAFDWLRNHAVGAVMPNLNTGIIKALPLILPSISEQRELSIFLGALDDRITFLRETNATLEAIAQALFKSWFIDFDPVHAKQQGSAPEGMDEATAALFPGSFEESELGLVPKGWQPQRLESFIELAYGKALKSTDRIPGNVPVYGSGGITGYHNESLTNGPSVIVGRKGTVGSLYWEDLPFFPIDTVFYVRSAAPMTYCFYLLRTLGLADMNTDAAVPGLNRNNVYRLPVALPMGDVLKAFDGVTKVIRESIFRNQQQAQTLATLRDTLLPRLISGQLRLPEAGAMAAEAA
ncbi:MAG TPA: restriction endonuclease subunit S [Azonexus sp.]|nr:restriction endonuclease subunit S [Azonexus sp.]